MENYAAIRADSASAVTSVNATEFIERIRKQSYAGCGFVPFLGSGISADSGILMGQQFKEYLSYVVWLCVADPKVTKNERRWDLRKNGWPEQPTDSTEYFQWISNLFELHRYKKDLRTESQIQGGNKTVKSKRKKKPHAELPDRTSTATNAFQYPLVPEILCGEKHCPKGWEYNEEVLKLAKVLRLENWASEFSQAPGESQTSMHFIERRAIHSLHNWRATLWFLSQLRLQGDGTLILDKPDTAIIDLFNFHITRGRRPNFGHLLLAQLARPLRFRVIFSTNFDPLLEAAFDEVSEPLTVFHVSAKGGLPDAKIVRAQNSLIKLHGGLAETRADFTLDETPTVEDFKRFYETVTGKSASGLSGIQNHMLVAGYSGSDPRCVHLIKHVLDRDPNLQLFWICRGKRDVETVTSLFDKEYKGSRVIVTDAERPDLLLYQLYQRVTLSLPPGGFSYAYTHRVPPAPASHALHSTPSSNNKENPDKSNSSWVETLHASGYATKRWVLSENDGSAKPYSQHLGQSEKLTAWEVFPLEMKGSGKLLLLDGNGILDRAREWHQWETTQGKKCIWLELEDTPTPEAALHELLSTLALHRGAFQLEHIKFISEKWVPPSQEKDTEPWIPPSLAEVHGRIKQLCQQMKVRAAEWTFLLYARTVPGACAGWNGDYWKDEHYERWHLYLQALVESGFTVVYMPFSEQRQKSHWNRINRVVNTMLARYGAIRDWRLEQSWDANSGKWIDPFVAKTKWGDKGPDVWRPPWLKHALDTLDGEESKSEFEQYTLMNSQFPPSPKEIDSITQVPHGHATLEQSQKFGTFTRLSENWIWKGLVTSDAGQMVFKDLERPPLKKSEGLKLQFVYGLALYRKSRHPNAIFNDAVFRCPYRFNLDGWDNDWERHKATEKWIQQLENEGVFRLKPGGYEWMYRDTRTALLRTFEAQTNWQVIDLEQPEVRIEHAGHLRGRMQSFIADWYFNAFCSTGHITPLQESLFHRMQALQYCIFDKRSNHQFGTDDEVIWVRRILLFKASLSIMVKTLMLVRPWVQFWVAEPAAASLFIAGPVEVEQIWTRFDITIRALLDDGKQLLKRDQTEEKLTEIKQLKNRVKTEFEGLSAYACRGSRKILNPSTRTGDEVTPFEVRLDAGNDTYEEAFKEFLKKKNVSSSVLQVFDFTTGTTGAASFLKWLWDIEDSSLFCAIQLLAEHAFLHVKRAKLEGHAFPSSVNEKNRRAKWKSACNSCSRALKIIPYLPPAFFNHETQEKIKILTLYGLSLGHLGRYFEAHRRFNEALALLSKQSIIVDPLELAKIQLRRAEVCLLEAADARECMRLEDNHKAGREEPNSVLLETLRVALDLAEVKADLKEGEEVMAKPDYRNLRSMLLSDYKRSENVAKSICAAKIDDAWCLLEKAESRLSGKSHASQWWNRWLILSLRAYAAARQWVPDINTLPFRIPGDADGRIDRLFKSGFLLADGDHYRQLRLIEPYWLAIKGREDEVEICDRLIDHLNTIKKACDRAETPRLLRDYAERLHNEISSVPRAKIENVA